MVDVLTPQFVDIGLHLAIAKKVNWHAINGLGSIHAKNVKIVGLYNERHYEHYSSDVTIEIKCIEYKEKSSSSSVLPQRAPFCTSTRAYINLFTALCFMKFNAPYTS